MSMPPDHLLLH